MIDLESEKLLTFSEAGRLPFVNRDKSQVYRWCKYGLRNVRLEFLQCGGTRYTSREAITRFFERLSDPRLKEEARTPSRRKRDVARADADLAKEGII